MATTTPMLVIVAGATGDLAGRIIHKLLQIQSVQVRGYARSPEKITESIREHERFSVVQGQVDDKAKIREAIRGASVVICAYQGYDDVMYDGQKYLIDACEELGVERYFASDWTLEYDSLSLGQHEGKDCMLKVKAYLQGKRTKGVHIYIGCFVETFLGYMNVWDPETTAFTFWGNGDEPWDLTTFDDAAAYTVATVLDPSAVGILRFRGDKKSTREIAQLYEKVYGRVPKLVSRGTITELYDFMQAEKQKYVGQNKWLYMTWFYQYYILNGQTLLKEPIHNKRYPNVQPHSMESFFKANDVSNPKHLIRPL
ncbi:hypothetical protein LTR84_010767 [Exophiala bonariae]|uniref:NmrA-like domain-containing protein n=1 Tax=Exophiala bonariae TaxID=1690606 RepID=A0AAV9MVE0_9EURO|nr:hypothetical protein LTR84_010767 [Exophiala bonariae]